MKHIIICLLLVIVSVKLNSQHLYINLKNGTTATFSLSQIRSITYSNNLLNLNQVNGSVQSWNVGDILNCRYDEGVSNIEDIQLKPLDAVVYPNPSDGIIYVQCKLLQSSSVSIEVIDFLGRRIQTVFNDNVGIGEHTWQWNGVNYDGNRVDAGYYIISIIIDGRTINKKIFITK